MKKIKTIFLFMALFAMQMSALAQNITLNKSNVPLKEIMDEIEKKTDYKFLYRGNAIDTEQKVSIALENVSVEDALKALLTKTKIDFRINGKQIVLTPKTASPDVSLNRVEGRVTDKDGNPLPGATVLIKGTTKGTTTDANGNYAIKVPEGSVLVFSFVGFHKQEISVSPENTEINVVMEQKAAELGEFTVISTGYQLIKPEQSTGSIATMRTKEYDSRINTTDFLSGLENRIPGLLINNDVEFEGNSLFQIRGISTIKGNKDPLIVVDGYPTELSLDMINPNEIESVTVLKDAAAATVYGVRASNGVIVIERKKAKAGKVNVNFRTTIGFTPKENYDRYRWDDDASNITIDYSLAENASLFVHNFWPIISDSRAGYMYDFQTPVLLRMQQVAGIIDSTQLVQELRELGAYNNAEDYSRLFLRTASTRTYNLDISGGNENALYYITANYTASDLSEIKNDNSRFMLSGRSTINFSDRLSLDLTTDFQQTKSNSVPIPHINTIYPYEHFEDEDGNPLPVFNGSNANPYYNDAMMALGLKDNMYYPLVDINEISDKIKTVNNRITANFHYNIGNGFSLKFGGVYETSRTDTKHLASENSSEFKQYFNFYSTLRSGQISSIIPEGSILKQSKSSRESYTIRAQLNYDKQINKNHSLNLIFGGELRDVLDKASSEAYFGYNDQTLLHQALEYNYNDLSSFRATYAKDNSRLYYGNLFTQDYEENRYISMYSNVVYAYKGKYSLTGSMRIEQSNLFGTNPKYKYKPLWSLGAAWNIHKEDFMQDIKWVESLKLRAAYGFNGNVAKNALPQVITQASFNNLSSVSIPMLRLLSFANSGLRWEQTRNLNIGLDYTIFKNITGSIDYYTKKSTDILADNQIDATKGGSSAIINQASIRNNGLEISLHADWISRKKFNWNTGFIFSHNSSKVLQVYSKYLNRENNSGHYYLGGSFADYAEGYAVGSLFNYHYAGLNSDGEILIYDENDETKVLDAYECTKNDVYYAGHSIPSYNIGLSNRVDIGSFYVYCMINFYGGFKVRVPVPDPTEMRPLEGAGNYWREPGDEANPDVLPSIFYDDAEELANTDKYIVDGAYFTLGDLTASYSFRDSKWLKKTGISNLELRLQGHNLYTVGLNKYNYSKATGSYAKSYLTPTYTVGLYVNF